MYCTHILYFAQLNICNLEGRSTVLESIIVFTFLSTTCIVLKTVYHSEYEADVHGSGKYECLIHKLLFVLQDTKIERTLWIVFCHYDYVDMFIPTHCTISLNKIFWKWFEETFPVYW